MREYNKNAFENMLKDVQHGQNFDIAFSQDYSISTLEMWQIFIEQLKTKVEHEGATNQRIQANTKSWREYVLVRNTSAGFLCS